MPRSTRGRIPPEHEQALYRVLFENSREGQYVLDRETQRFLEVNPGFEDLTGYSRSELLDGNVSPEDLVHARDLELHENKLAPRNHSIAETYSFRLLRKDKSIRHVETTVSLAKVRGREVIVGSVRNLTHWREVEKRLRDEIAIQRRKTIEAARANVKLFELTEQVSTTYELTTSLVKSKNIDELFKESAKVLCDKHGLNCKDVTFYLLKNTTLEVAFTTKRKANRLKLSKNPRLRSLAEGELLEPIAGTHHIMIPFRSRDRVFGVLRVEFPRDAGKIDLETDDAVIRGRWDIFNTLVNVISVMIDNLRLYERVVQQSIKDPLTGLYNRRYFDRQAHTEFVRAGRFGKSLSFILIDIDNLKEINDEFGHQAGDEVLRQTANILKAHCREMDIIGRYGGDEFVVILLETGADAGLGKAEELCGLIAEHPFATTNGAPREIPVTISVGIASLSDEMQNESQLLESADRALYLAKGQGKNRSCRFEPKRSEDRPELHA